MTRPGRPPPSLRIATIEAWPVKAPLLRPYAIAGQRFDAAELMILRIVSEAGTAGLGAASPAPEITGETFEACAAALAPASVAPLVGRDVTQLGTLLDELRQMLPRVPAARAAVDGALHDLAAKHLGRLVVDVLGRVHGALPTSITIGIKGAAETLEEAAEYVGRGFRILKVKTGESLDQDLERLSMLRERFGPEVILRADANQGYAPAEVPRFFAAAGHTVEFLEQPLPRGEEEALRALPEDIRRRLAADESLHDADDALALAREPRPYGIFNIKLMKCGGIDGARAIAGVAVRAGIDLMWGCMDESVISIAAALHAAGSCRATRYLDLDGSFDLERDPARGGFTLEGGRLRVLERPGLGVEIG